MTFQMPHASACSRKIRPKSAKTAATMPDAAPLPSSVDLLGDLGLGEGDLFLDEDLRALGDLLDGLAEL